MLKKKIIEPISRSLDASIPDVWRNVLQHKDDPCKDFSSLIPGKAFLVRPQAGQHDSANASRRKQSVRRIINAGALTAIFVVIIAVALTQAPLFLPSASGQHNTGLSQTNIPSPSASTSTETASQSTEAALVLNGSPVLFSSLKFGYTEKIKYPEVDDMTEQMCLLAFSEEMLEDSLLIIKGTVEDMRSQKYFQNYTTMIYQVRIDKIFFSELDLSEGDLFTVEQRLYGGSIQDAEFGMQPGGQYFLPIYEGRGYAENDYSESEGQKIMMESPYSIVYPFIPMIQTTTDGGYLFYGGWKHLVNEDTVDVIIDVETIYGTPSYVRNLKLRADDNFEKDFQSLVDLYCPIK